MGYSFWLAARVLLYASSHRQDNTYHGLCYTSRGALAGTRNSSMGPPHEGSIRRHIAPWANALTTELHLAPIINEWICSNWLKCEVNASCSSESRKALWSLHRKWCQTHWRCYLLIFQLNKKILDFKYILYLFTLWWISVLVVNRYNKIPYHKQDRKKLHNFFQ